PGGRLVVLDTDWDSVVWSCADRERGRRVLDAFDAHCADAHIARHLPALLRNAGFEGEAASVVPILNTAYHPHTYSYHMLRTIARFAAQHGVDDADAWREDVEAMAARGEYFFSLNRYLFVASRG